MSYDCNQNSFQTIESMDFVSRMVLYIFHILKEVLKLSFLRMKSFIIFASRFSISWSSCYIADKKSTK